MTISLIIFLILSGLYYILLLGIFYGMRKLSPSGAAEHLPEVSIVIAARDEQNRIVPCLQHLERIDYPPERFEIILIDDNSLDETPALMVDYCARHPNWKMFRLNDSKRNLSGKRNALEHGISEARGDIIFTTDADCLVPRFWLKGMVRYFTPQVVMVLGYSPLLPGRGFWNSLLQFDNLFSAIVSAAPTKLGYPFNSVGRNLAYSRAMYHRVGGYQALKKFRSGDDVHLTEHFRVARLGRIDFSADADTFVFTQPVSGCRNIFNQQIRKNSKVLKVSPGTVMLFMSVFLYHLFILLLPFIDPAYIIIWGSSLFFKLLLEQVCLLKAVNIFQQKSLQRYLLPLQIIYPMQIIFFSILGIFQKYTWKN